MGTTSFARLEPRQAQLVLCAIGLLTVAAVAVTLSPLASSNLIDRPTAGDVALYRAEIERIRHGEGYYQAAAAELTARGYPTRSVFNWRTPLPIWFLGKLPVLEMGKVLLGSLALLLILLAFAAVAREDDRRHPRRTPWRAVACVLLLTGPLMPVLLGQLFVMPILWAGVCLALSVCAYGSDRRGWGVAFGLASLAFRELALPYGVLCLALAWHERRHREMIAWLLGLSVWALLYMLHGWHVSTLMTSAGHAHRSGWIQFGGAAFVISIAQMNAYLLLLPQWVTALYLAAAMVGMAGWDTSLGRRIGLTTCLFLVAFAMVGQGFNQYWGSLIAPLLCFGVVRCPASLHDLWSSATSGCCQTIRV